MGIDLRRGYLLVVQPDRNNAVGAEQFLGGCGEFFRTGRLQRQLDNRLRVTGAAGSIVHSRGGFHIVTGQYQLADGANHFHFFHLASLFIKLFFRHRFGFCSLAELQHSGLTQFRNGLLRIKVLLICFPREPDNDLLVRRIGVDFVIGDVVRNQTL